MKKFYFGFVLLLLLGKVSAQLTVTSLPATYSNNFNSYNPNVAGNVPSTINSTGTGTGFASTTTGWTASTVISTPYNIPGNGAGAGGGYWAHGTTGEYSIGAIRTGSAGETVVYTISFINNSPNTITSLTISWDYEQWRYGSAGNTAGWNCTGTGQISANATLNAKDFAGTGGTAGTTGGLSTPVSSFTLSGLSILNGQSFGITWVTTDFTGADNGVSIDNFTLTAGCATLAAPVATAASLLGSSGFTANWNTVAGAASYNLDVYNIVPNTVAAEWTFPSLGTTVTPSTASTNPNNTAKTLTVNGTGIGTIGDQAGATTRAPSVNGWNSGLGTKFWQVIIDATGFSNMKISSKQYSSGTGPRDFKLQYSLDGSSYTDITVIPNVGDATWLSGGAISNVTIPAACNNQPAVYLRWIMTSNTSANAGTVASGGTSRIDDISITGDGTSYVSGYQNFSTTDLSEEIAGLSSNTTYYYVVRTTTVCGSSANSNQITVTTDPPCTPTAVITSFSPTTGPAGTLVTITGTGFTGATAVKFGSVSVSSSLFTVVSSTKIIVETPANAPTDKISVTVAGCDGLSATNFTPLSQAATCSNNSGFTSNLFISEVYDAESGSLSYIEIFNGTASAVNLASGNYIIRLITGTSTVTDITLSGTVASGATYLVLIGSSSSSCTGLTIGSSNPSASGFNGNDRVYLGTKVGAVFTSVDYVPNPDYPGSANPGFSQSRKATAVAPKPSTYAAGDWTISTTENCSNLGIAPYTIGGSSITINTQPQDENDCSAISFAVGATATPAGVDSYAWKYFNTATGTWDDAANITNATIGIAANNTTTATMTITGNTAQIIDYQFYCQLVKGTCTLYTNAVQYTYNTRPYYRNTITGNWSNPAIWQMSNSSSDWSAATTTCMYPTKQNCSGVYIQSPYTVTQDIPIDIDYLNINSGGTLTTSLNSKLIVSDSTTGADFVVDGTWNYDANSTNSYAPEIASGTWKLGTNGIIIKTNDGSSSNLRDYYDGGMSTMLSTPNWIIRYTGAADVSFTTVGTYYPNLTFESNSGAWAPSVAQSRFTGNTGYATVYGNLNIGGSGTGTVTITNENTNAQPLLVNGTTTIVANNTLTTAGSANGTGYELKGNLTVNGTLTAISNNVGLLKLSATTGTQTVSGTGTMNLEHVTAANTSSTILLNRDITIPGILTSSDGSNLNLNTGNITMKSTDTGTARVAPINTGIIGYGTGQFIIERNVDDLRSWRLLSIPVVTSQTMRQAWMEGALPSTGSPVSTRNEDPVPNYGTHISGPSPALKGFDETPLNNYSVKYYTGTAWVGTGIQPDTSHLKYKAGWMLFVRGPRSYPISTTTANTTPQITTLRTKGQIYVGTQPTITPVGFTVVGNPYPSAVNFSNITKTGAGDIYYIWDPRLATNSSGTSVGGFVTMTRGAGTTYTPTPNPPGLLTPIDVTTGRIESGAAFVVNSSNITSLNFKETDKSGLSALVFRPHGQQEQPEASGSLRTNLYVRNGDGTSALFDGVLHLFGRSYNSKVDGADALKFITFAENLAIRSNDTVLSVEKRSTLTYRDTLQYWLKQLRLKNYTFEFVADKIAANNLTGYVEDRFLQTTVPLDMKGTTKVDFSVTTDPGSYATDRFRIVFRKMVKFGEIDAECNEADIDVTWNVEEVNDINSFEVERSTDGKNFSGVGYTIDAANSSIGKRGYQWTDESVDPGFYYYRIKATGNNGLTAYSDIAKVKVVRNAHAAFISPNPVTGNEIHLWMNKMPQGKYQALLTDEKGLVISTTQFNYPGGNASHIIKTGDTRAAGIYQLQLSGPGKVKTVLKVLVK